MRGTTRFAALLAMILASLSKVNFPADAGPCRVSSKISLRKSFEAYRMPGSLFCFYELLSGIVIKETATFYL